MDTTIVKMGEVYVTDKPERLSTFGVGSCVVIILVDAEKHIAGMAHAMLSEGHATALQMETHPLRYIGKAIDALLAALATLGPPPLRLHAHLIGGAQMFTEYHTSSVSIGTANIACAKHEFQTHHIPVLTDSTGGTEGKNVHYDTDTDTVTIDTRATILRKT